MCPLINTPGVTRDSRLGPGSRVPLQKEVQVYKSQDVSHTRYCTPAGPPRSIPRTLESLKYSRSAVLSEAMRRRYIEWQCVMRARLVT